jgi:DNA (cytosine-5)-methyltransferase 1
LGVDNDPYALETYHNNLGAATLCADLSVTPPAKIMECARVEPGEATVLMGCPPCQGFSKLGRESDDDPRNDLVHCFTRAVKAIRPLFVAFENVPAIEGRDEYFGRMMRALRAEGYLTDRRIVDMRDYGVPQRRVRLVAVGCRDPEVWGRFSFPEPTHSASGTDGKHRWVTVREAIGGLPPVREREGYSRIANHESNGHGPAVSEKISMIPKDGGSRRDLPRNLWYDCHKGRSGFNDVLGRMAWDRPSPVITTGCCNPTKGRFLHPDQDRAITPREAARLQTFPDSYVFYGARKHVQIHIGNAFPPLYAKLLAKRIRAAIGDAVTE